MGSSYVARRLKLVPVFECAVSGHQSPARGSRWKAETRSKVDAYVTCAMGLAPI